MSLLIHPQILQKCYLYIISETLQTLINILSKGISILLCTSMTDPCANTQNSVVVTFIHIRGQPLSTVSPCCSTGLTYRATSFLHLSIPGLTFTPANSVSLSILPLIHSVVIRWHLFVPLYHVSCRMYLSLKELFKICFLLRRTIPLQWTQH